MDQRKKKRPKAHLKIDTGLSRQGFLWSSKVSEELIKHPDLRGVCTHFANVEDVLEQEFGLLQIDRFRTWVTLLKDARPEIVAHSAATAAAMLIKESHLDFVRVGIGLYGLWPSRLTRLSFEKVSDQPLTLKPVLSWFTRLEQIKEIPSGSYVGYGCAYRSGRSMKIGIIPVGYYDGYSRLSGDHQAYILVKGMRCPLLGRISMNILVCDLSSVPNAEVGDLVTLIGESESEKISADLFASWSNTIHYEALARLGSHLKRVIV